MTVDHAIARLLEANPDLLSKRYDKEAAKKLVEAVDFEESGGMVSLYDDPKDVDHALGSGRETRAIVAVWWD